MDTSVVDSIAGFIEGVCCCNQLRILLFDIACSDLYFIESLEFVKQNIHDRVDRDGLRILTRFFVRKGNRLKRKRYYSINGEDV
ncbi:MAG: hypothetical protein QM654_10635 [Dysgonamonadaceae bacterium]